MNLAILWSHKQPHLGPDKNLNILSNNVYWMAVSGTEMQIGAVVASNGAHLF